MTTIAISGGFDPIHKGHVRLMRDARLLGDKLVVILNNDNWLTTKKGRPFMSQDERKEILLSIVHVNDVVITNHKPNDSNVSVCDELKQLKPDIFANGGDRKAENIPEYDLCEEFGIEMKFNVGGEKIQSSSKLVKNARN